MAFPGRTVIGVDGEEERVGTVVRLGLTPLKGAAHTHPERIAVRSAEVVGDRRWALIEPVRDGWRVVRTVETPGMTAVRARCDAAGVLDLELPDGRRYLIPRGVAGGGVGSGGGVGGGGVGRGVGGGDDHGGGDHGGAVVAEYWGRPAHVHLARGPWNDALSGSLGREVHLVTVDRPGAVVFAEPVSIVTTSSVQEVARRAGDWWTDGSGEGDEVDGGVDDERFRSTLVIDTPGLPAFVEDTWVGARLRIGAVELTVRQRLARCGVIRIRPGTGVVGGPDLLRLLAPDRVVSGEVVFGLGADVDDPGEIFVGNPVILVGR